MADADVGRRQLAAGDEMLDYFDANGVHRGVAKRAEVHEKGLWHRTLHLWLATEEDGGALFYQLRSANAANWPGLLDVSVAGHLLAGETYLDGMREAREEIGVEVPPAAVIALGVRHEDAIDPSGRNRELQGVHLARLDPAWGRFDPLDGEAAGLFRIVNRDGLRLFGGEAKAIDCAGLIADRGAVRASRRTVTLASFVPRDLGYYRRMHVLAGRLLDGRPIGGLDADEAR